MHKTQSGLPRRIRRIRRKFFLLVTVPTAAVTLGLAVMDAYRQAIKRKNSI
ncbi:MAG: hypothetical protein ACOX8F_05645 [Sakamotonia sp.]|jgi:hypothetical protein